MKPVMVSSGREALSTMRALVVHSNGTRLQIVFATDDQIGAADRIFQWPWKLDIGPMVDGMIDERSSVF